MGFFRKQREPIHFISLLIYGFLGGKISTNLHQLKKPFPRMVPFVMLLQAGRRLFQKTEKKVQILQFFIVFMKNQVFQTLDFGGKL